MSVETHHEPSHHAPLRDFVNAYLTAVAGAGKANTTVKSRRLQLTPFLAWAGEHGITTTCMLTVESLAAFPVWMFDHCRRDPPVLAWSTASQRVRAVRLLCRWATRHGLLLADPTLLWELPRLPRRLPRAVFSESEMERVLTTVRLTTPLGLRDRAIMELMYSSGIRRMELVKLDVDDIQLARGILQVREGKGRKDRVVPFGRRAREWVERYLQEERLTYGFGQTRALFVSMCGTRIRATRLTERFHTHIVRSGVNKTGSCHIIRHTTATLLHDHGADIRDIQELLGHAELSSTQIYTHISGRRLKQVHAKTHPAERAYRREK